MVPKNSTPRLQHLGFVHLSLSKLTITLQDQTNYISHDYDCFDIGYTIKKGWNINVDARSIHCDPTLYRNPHKFDPSRFDVSLCS